MSITRMRMPRMHGLPPHWPGSIVIRSESSITETLALAPIHSKRHPRYARSLPASRTKTIQNSKSKIQNHFRPAGCPQLAATTHSAASTSTPGASTGAGPTVFVAAFHHCEAEDIDSQVFA